MKGRMITAKKTKVEKPQKVKKVLLFSNILLFVFFINKPPLLGPSLN
jgi:hypothetical protein